MTTRAEIAAETLVKKLRLERAVTPEIRRVFKEQVAAFRRYVARNGRSPGAEEYRDDIQAVLRVHYKRVQRAFRNDVAKNSGFKSITEWMTKAGEDDQIAEDLTDEALAEWVRDHVESQSGIVTDTTSREMEEAIAEARRDSVADGLPTDSASIASLAAVYLSRKLATRVPVIATFETQSAAEATKFISVEAMAGKIPHPLLRKPGLIIPPRPAVRREATKEWVTQGDRIVRPAHVAANRQKVSYDASFTVMGQSLRFPGDMAQGASVSNTANCRCMSLYEAIP